jgi:RNA polymerase sigma-70 factor, ECF subfamily
VLEGFRRGDPDAFMTVYDAHAAALRPLVARFFVSPFEREEAAQEIWLQVHRVAASYDPARGPLVPWLRAVATNRCREILRARGRRPNLAAEEAAAREDLASPADPDREARSARLRQAIDGFLAGLDGEQAGVFRLALLEDLGHDEVARRLGISARRCKYLKLKLLERAASSAALKQALDEVLER